MCPGVWTDELLYEEYLTRGNPRVTARLPSEPVRVTNWLAGWLDYVFAIVLVAGRWLRAPLSRSAQEPVMLSAFAPAMPDAYGPRWHDAAPQGGPQSGRLVKAAEIVMLSISFFLAAHLLSGGTQTVSAPDLNPLGLLPAHARAEGLVVPAPASKQIDVQADSFVYSTSPTTAATQPGVSQAAVLAPGSDASADAAAATPAATPAPEPPAAAAVVEPPPPPAPVAAATQPPAVVQDAGRYLTPAELHAAALAAGWPAELLPEIEVVAWCESRFHTHAEYYGAMGLMQVVSLWFDVAGVEYHWWDPVTNLKAAKAAYDEQVRNGVEPWGPWPGCKPAAN